MNEIDHMRGRNSREENVHPPCRDDPCEFYQDWSRVDAGKEFKVHCGHPDHPNNPRAIPDEKCPKLIERDAPARARKSSLTRNLLWETSD